MTSSADRPSPVAHSWTRQLSLEEQGEAKGTRPIDDGSFYVHEDAFPEPGEQPAALFDQERAGSGVQAQGVQQGGHGLDQAV